MTYIGELNEMSDSCASSDFSDERSSASEDERTDGSIEPFMSEPLVVKICIVLQCGSE